MTTASDEQRDLNWQRLELRGLLKLLPAYIIIDEVLDVAENCWTGNHQDHLAFDAADIAGLVVGDCDHCDTVTDP